MKRSGRNMMMMAATTGGKAARLALFLVAATHVPPLSCAMDRSVDAHIRSNWHDSDDAVGGFMMPPSGGGVEHGTGPSLGEGSFDGQHQTGGRPQQQQQQQRTEEIDDSPVYFTSTNVYPSVVWSPWQHLAEPHRETVLTANSAVGDPDNDMFMWTIASENGYAHEGREVRHIFKNIGRQSVTLTQTVAATGEQYVLKSDVMVKYVRRELRELNEDDRKLFFDVLEILYRLPTEDGVNVYGPEYKGIDYFVKMHLDGAGTKECDHWHDDAGIMTHHVGYTLLFEQSMQLLAPSIAIPYWEYTIEASQKLSYYGDSIVFDDDWFGEFNPQNNLHTVERGRFAYLPIQQDSWQSVHNSYGLLRTPWNLNGDPYVTRHNMTNNEVPTTMVSCQSYQMCLESLSLSMMNTCLNGLTHGPVHIMIGGQWDNDEEEFISKSGYYMLAPQLTKYLWRKGYLRLPEYCAPGRECKGSCPSEVYESRGMTRYDVLMDVNALAWMAALTRGVLSYNADTEKFEVAGHEDDEEFQQAFWGKMLHSFCDAGNVGEMYTSAAPYDPLFWVVHPSSDRMLAWRRMLGWSGAEGWDFDETFGYDHGWVVGETGVVCDWSGVEEGSNDMPKCVKGVCGGHKEHDVLPFTVKINGELRQFTNAGWLELINPTNNDLPYMYDNFEWKHCSAEGYEMGTSSI